MDAIMSYPRMAESEESDRNPFRKFLIFFGIHPAQKRHKAHRIGGLLFLVQYFYSVYLFAFDYSRFSTTSPLLWSMPLNGWIQAISASLTFTFLPKKKEPGYTAFGDIGAISYFYVVENTFFSMLLFFAWCYFSSTLFPIIRKMILPELVFVFLPYLPCIRFRWPVSSFRDSLTTMDKGMTPTNRRFFVISTHVVKAFYIFSKHYIGFFTNYLRFLGRVENGSDEQRLAFGLLLGGTWGTTVALFIHTLKFKGYISARVGALAYEASFPWMGYYFFRLAGSMKANWDVALVATLGAALNFATTRRRPIWHCYQVIVMILMATHVYSREWGFESPFQSLRCSSFTQHAFQSLSPMGAIEISPAVRWLEVLKGMAKRSNFTETLDL